MGSVDSGGSMFPVEDGSNISLQDALESINKVGAFLMGRRPWPAKDLLDAIHLKNYLKALQPKEVSPKPCSVNITDCMLYPSIKDEVKIEYEESYSDEEVVSQPFYVILPDDDDDRTQSLRKRTTNMKDVGVCLRLVEKKFKCNRCQFKTAHKWHLDKHVKIHTRKNYFKCNYCFYRFTTQEELKIHVILHKDKTAKPYKCPHCSYASKFITHLKLHSVIHTGERPYACTICDFTAAFPASLHKHMFTHGERKFTCDICGSKFRDKSSLKRHITSHSDNKRYKCDHPGCAYSSHYTHNLKFHKLTHGNTKTLKCDGCDFTTRHAFDLKRHKKLHEKRALLLEKLK